MARGVELPPLWSMKDHFLRAGLMKEQETQSLILRSQVYSSMMGATKEQFEALQKDLEATINKLLFRDNDIMKEVLDKVEKDRQKELDRIMESTKTADVKFEDGKFVVRDN